MMISAEEARKQSSQRINDIATKQLSIIEEKINKAISEGMCKIYYEKKLDSAARMALTRLGYKVETGSQYNEEWYCISW